MRLYCLLCGLAWANCSLWNRSGELCTVYGVYGVRVGIQEGTGRRCVHLRPVRRRSALGPRPTRAERVVPSRAVRRPAARLAQAVQACWHSRQTDLRVASLQDEREAWHAVDDWSLDQLRHFDDDSKHQAAGALDRTRRRTALPTGHVVCQLAQRNFNVKLYQIERKTTKNNGCDIGNWELSFICLFVLFFSVVFRLR